MDLGWEYRPTAGKQLSESMYVRDYLRLFSNRHLINSYIYHREMAQGPNILGMAHFSRL